jgi:lipopolysaccharide/colanic/teichoic acid biosynthesis glycosyltransferase
MRWEKRLFDIFWAALGLLVLSPLFFVIALLIKVGDGGPVFFRQERVGYQGAPFHIWKFRTMVVDADKGDRQLTVGRDPRITRVGHFLRRFKLDELPQLVNVLLGEMSFVGPRPEVPRYVALYNEEQRQVLNLVPGVTDEASIAYRRESDLLASASDPESLYIEEIMPQKIAINLLYAERANLWADWMVILRTVTSLLPTHES